jgi:hypothetical protein
MTRAFTRRRSVAGRVPVEQVGIPLFSLTANGPPPRTPLPPVVAPLAPAPAPRPMATGLWGSAASENRGRQLEAAHLADGRAWLDVLAKACLSELVSLKRVLAGDASPAARAAREAALAELVAAGAGEEHQVALVLGIDDHRARPERDRTGAGGST